VGISAALQRMNKAQTAERKQAPQSLPIYYGSVSAEGVPEQAEYSQSFASRKLTAKIAMRNSTTDELGVSACAA
jgi:hypothetical protein